MKKIDIYEYYRFGYNYYILRFRCNGLMVHGPSPSLEESLDDFFRYLSDLELKVTEKAAGPLVTLGKNSLELPTGTKVDNALADKIKLEVDRLDATLDAELQLRYAYIVQQKRFGLDDLLSQIGNLFAKTVYENLPDLTKFDFQSAGKCIAFELPTAAAFHTMRGLEGVLRQFYCEYVKRGRVDPMMWYAMVAHLKKRKDGPKKALLDHLDHIRFNFRNPTQHPEARYDSDEVQDLLSLAIDCTNRMIIDISTRKTAKR